MRLFFWRRRKMSEGEFLRYVMRTVSYDGRELNLQPPKKKTQVESPFETIDLAAARIRALTGEAAE